MTWQRVEDRRTRRLRWIACGSGAMIAGFWVFIGMLQAFAGSNPWTVESAILAGLIVAAALAVAMAWWRAGLGWLLVMLVGIAHCIFGWIAAGHHKFSAMAIAGLPFLLVGALFILSWWLSHRRDATLM